MYASRSKRTTRTSRGSTSRRSRGSTSRDSRRGQVANDGPVRKWVQVMRPPAANITFKVAVWVLLTDLSDKEREAHLALLEQNPQDKMVAAANIDTVVGDNDVPPTGDVVAEKPIDDATQANAMIEDSNPTTELPVAPVTMPTITLPAEESNPHTQVSVTKIEVQPELESATATATATTTATIDNSAPSVEKPTMMEVEQPPSSNETNPIPAVPTPPVETSAETTPIEASTPKVEDSDKGKDNETDTNLTVAANSNNDETIPPPALPPVDGTPETTTIEETTVTSDQPSIQISVDQLTASKESQTMTAAVPTDENPTNKESENTSVAAEQPVQSDDVQAHINENADTDVATNPVAAATPVEVTETNGDEPVLEPSISTSGSDAVDTESTKRPNEELQTDASDEHAAKRQKH